QIRGSRSDLARESDSVSQVRGSGSDLATESVPISGVRGSGIALAPKSDDVLGIRGALSDLTKTIMLPRSSCKYSLSSALSRTLSLWFSFVVARTPATQFLI